jgi:hypothetical protein
MQIDRTTIISGPAKITYGGQSFWSKGDIVERPIYDRFNISNSHWGDVDTRETNREYEISFEPDGRFTNELGAILYPYMSLAMGASIIGDTDRALVVHGRDGKKRTYHNAALTKIPDANFDTGRTLQGSCTFTAIVKNNTDPTNAAAYYTDATEAYPGDSGWDLSNIVTKPPICYWGENAPWNAFKTKNGIVISFALDVYKRKVSGIGTIDMILRGLTVTAKATPMVSRQAIADMMRADAQMGSSIDVDHLSLSVGNEFIECSIANVAIVDASFVSGMENERVGEVTWQANRTITDGTANPLFNISEVV